MTEFTFQIILIAVPGLFAIGLYDRLNGRKKRGATDLLLTIILFSISAYLVFSVIQGLSCSNKNAFSDLFSEKITIGYKTVLGVTLCALIIALVMTYANTYYWINRIGFKFCATNRYGDPEVWEFFINEIEKRDLGEYVFVRDHELHLLYFGRIHTWSDSGPDRELHMTDVSVHDNETGDKKYETDNLYICRSRTALTIEVNSQMEQNCD